MIFAPQMLCGRHLTVWTVELYTVHKPTVVFAGQMQSALWMVQLPHYTDHICSLLQYCTYGVHNNFLHKPTVEFALGAQMWSTHKPTVVFAAQMQSAAPRSSVVDAAKRSSLCAVNNMKYTNVQFTIHSCIAYFVDASKQMFKQCLHWLQMGWLEDSLAGRIYLFPACY